MGIIFNQLTFIGQLIEFQKKYLTCTIFGKLHNFHAGSTTGA